MGLVNVLATLPGLLLIDYIGRRRLLRGSALGMFLACVVCGISLSQFPPECMQGDCGRAARAPDIAVHGFVFAMVVFICSFACGWGPVAWVYCAEIFPLRLRSKAIGVT